MSGIIMKSKEDIHFLIGQPNNYNGENKPWYDTKEGVTEAIKTLEGFIRLVNERHTAGYERQERLNEFYVFGRYMLTQSGNCGKEDGGILQKLPGLSFPDVLDHKEFFIKLDKIFPDSYPLLMYSLNGGNLPKPNLKCPYCGKTWDIGNCQDTVVQRRNKGVLLTEYFGKTLGELKAILEQKDDAVYSFQYDHLIRNDKYIDLSLEYPNPDPTQAWQKDMPKNKYGWLKDSDIDDSYIIQDGDEANLSVEHYYHIECDCLATDMEGKFKSIFEKAGFKVISINRLPNDRPGGYPSPRFKVVTDFGTMLIGWCESVVDQKDVINIEWQQMDMYIYEEKTGLPAHSFICLFKEEETIKWESGVYAVSWQKAEEYLASIYKYLTFKLPEKN